MGRFYALVILDILFGIFCIVFGLYGDFEEAIYFGYMCFGLGTALLIWATIKIALNVGMKSSLCPKCGYKFSWGEHWAFTQGFSSRKASPCPGCQTVLIKSKWPWRITNASQWILVAFVCVLNFTESGTPLYYYLSFALLLVFTVSSEFGMATLRFEIVDEPKESS